MLWVIKLLSVLILISISDASPGRYFPDTSRQVKAAESDGRLALDVIPTNYDLSLTLEDEFYKAKSFTGTVKITLDVNKNVSSFQLHAKDLAITSTTLSKDNEIVAIGPLEAPDANDLFTIKCNDTEKYLMAGATYFLTIEYGGKLSDKSMKGFYLSSYTDSDNTVKYLATTQFEEMGARSAFPCFDEPAFKATFNITINFPQNYSALSNTKALSDGNNATSVTFALTPPMSTYLVAFIVSEFGCVYSEDKKIEVCGRKEANETMELALNTAPHVLERMENYTGYDYFDTEQLTKLTQVAIPDFAAGAMENWGLVTYREVDLLWDKDQSSNSYKQLVVTVIAHELSHQWFGNLVTLNWWSEIFLNEGFATYFEYHIPNEIEDYKDWELTKQFVIEQMQTALVTDSLGAAFPLSYDTTDPEIINSRFDDISYNKGGSILRMVQHVLGLDNFKTWLSDYIKNKTLSTSTSDDLWGIYTSSASLPETKTLADVMDSWTKESGYPLLTVTANGTNVIIEQEHFALSGENKNTTWYVPITYTLSKDPNFSNTATKEWLLPDKNKILSDIMKDQEWIVLNNQQTGYYRVNYDQELLSKIQGALKKNINSIDEISRSQLVDDQLNLARANRKSYTDVLDFLTFLKNDTSYYSWYSAFVGFKFMLQKTADESVQKALEAYITELMSSLVDSVSFDKLNPDNQIYTLKQVLTQKWACDLGNETCIQTSKNWFANYTAEKPQDVPPNLRSIVYCNGLRNSDNATRDFEIVWEKYRSSSLADEKITLLNALGCVNNAAIRTQYLEKVLTSDVRIQDARYVFLSVASNNGADGVTDVLAFLIENYKKLYTYFGDDTTALPYAFKTASNLINLQSQVDLLTKFITNDNIDASLNKTAADGLETATNNLVVIKNLEDQLKKHFQLDNNSAVINSYHFINIIFVFVGYALFNY